MKILIFLTLIVSSQISLAKVPDPQNGVGMPPSMQNEKTEDIVGTIKPATPEETKKLEEDIRKAKARQKGLKKSKPAKMNEGTTNSNQPTVKPSK